MAAKLRADEARNHLVRILQDLASKQLKILLENKHLYQRVSFELKKEVESLQSEVIPSEVSLFQAFVRDGLPNERLAPSSQRLFTASKGSQEGPVEVSSLMIGNVKLFCSACKEREIFSPLWYRDIHNELRKPTRTPIRELEETPGGKVVQLFCLVYECQRCKGEPDGFLVRREGWHLILDGRSPMEHIEVPNHIPKPERPFFRDAMIAMHGGKTLAALFYLRKLIEQFARRQTGKCGLRATGDEIMEAYSATLPPQQRDQMPSLKESYDKLSEALHSARSEEAFFEEALGEIDRHFDIRRVFRIPDSSATTT